MGKIVLLRPLIENDVDGMLEWMQDEETQQWFQFPMKEKKRQEVMEFIKKAKASPEEGENIHLAIANQENQYLGTISLKNYQSRDKNAEFAISLRPSVRGKRIGEEAIKQLLHLAFEEWDFERVYLNVLSCNVRAIRLYERCGFVYEGEFIKHFYLNGSYQNLRWYGMIKENYIKSKNINSGGGGRIHNDLIFQTDSKIMLSSKKTNIRRAA